jgi:DNA-binding transcriptional LysR family regulator
MGRYSELKIFVAAAEEESFTRAAERLHLSQPAVSQTIRSLEDCFGADLFLRHGRSVRLSEAGEALLPLARDVMYSMIRLEEAMAGIHGDVVGNLVIGCSTSSGKYLLPILGSNFRQEYPRVRFQVQIHNRMEVITRILDERLKVGVVSKRIDDPDLEYQPFFEDRIILIVSADHPWGEYGKALPTDLIDQPLITRERTAGTSEVVFGALTEHGIESNQMDIVMELGNEEAIEMAVERGIGMAFVSKLAAARGLALGRIRKVEVTGMDLQRTIYMVRNVCCPMTRAHDRFWAFIQEQREKIGPQIWREVDHLALEFMSSDLTCKRPEELDGDLVIQEV